MRSCCGHPCLTTWPLAGNCSLSWQPRRQASEQKTTCKPWQPCLMQILLRPLALSDQSRHDDTKLARGVHEVWIARPYTILVLAAFIVKHVFKKLAQQTGHYCRLSKLAAFALKPMTCVSSPKDKCQLLGLKLCQVTALYGRTLQPWAITSCLLHDSTTCGQLLPSASICMWTTFWRESTWAVQK